MSLRLRDVLGRQLGELRHEPTMKRVRATLDGETVVDSTDAVLVWEPRRIVPSYAVPVEDVTAELVTSGVTPAVEPGAATGVSLPDLSQRPVLDPRVPFAVRSTAGVAVDIRVAATGRTVSAFRPSDPDLSDYLILDFSGFDSWLEEDDEIVGHPRDPFHRIDIRTSSRHVTVMLDGQVLADTTRARMLFETMLPVRYYLPAEDVVAASEPSPTRTYCAYKGEASYWSVDVAGRTVRDLAWSYQSPLPEAAEVKGYVAFFDERLDLVVDGKPRERPTTPWS